MPEVYEVPQSMIEANMFGMENEGICLACGEYRGGCEPDAENYPCECCGENEVFGLEQALLMGRITLLEDQ